MYDGIKNINLKVNQIFSLPLYVYVGLYDVVALHMLYVVYKMLYVKNSIIIVASDSNTHFNEFSSTIQSTEH